MKMKSQYIDGCACYAASNETFFTYNPANGEPLAEIGQSNVDDLHMAIESAKKGFKYGLR